MSDCIGLKTSKAKNIDMILSIGHVAFDMIAKMDKFPPKNEARPITSFKECPGGGAGNFAVVVRTLGEPASLYSIVGEDFRTSDAGKAYNAKLSHLRIKKHLLTVKKPTTRAWMFFAGDSYKSHFCGLFSDFSRQSVPRELTNAHIAHFTANMPAFVIPNMERLKKLNSRIILSFDPAYDIHLYDQKQMLKCLELTDYFSCNEHEIINLREKGIRVQDIVDKVDVLKVTEGPDGCKVYSKDIPNGFHVPTREVAVDVAVGGGDAHAAAFLVAQKRGLSLKQSARLANYVASEVVQGMGPQDNIPTWDQIPDRFKS